MPIRNAFKQLNLQTKFLMGLAVIMAVIGVFFASLLRLYLSETLVEEARGKAQVILKGVESLHAYVQDSLRPAITGALRDDNGLLEAMSCTALARASMGGAHKGGPADYTFRRVAIGARSPDLEARGLERDFIERFKADPGLEWAEVQVKENGQEYLVMAKPVRYQGFCLRCHGDPAKAPPELVAEYGPERGFHRKEGELAGAHVVRLPMRGGLERIRGATLGFVLMFSLGALILFAAISFFFNRLVTHNLRRALAMMGRHFPEAASVPAVAPDASSPEPPQDEIGQMLGSMEQFAGRLRTAITGERRMRELAQQNEKLAAVGRLAAGLAHEINNPLGVILCYGELLKAQELPQDSQDDVEVILRHTRLAQKVLRDLLDFVRPKKGGSASCDLAAEARRVVGVYQAQAVASGTSLRIDAPPNLPAVVADPAALEQILSNLIINALDAAPADAGEIGVTVGEEDRSMVLRVKDNGPGIPEENLGRIFDPFFTTKEVGKGSGLGLAVVFGLVMDMGGSVEASGSPGAEFTVRLPLARAAAKEADHEAA